MSKESAKAFLEKMRKDTAFVKRIIDCWDAEERKALVESEGFKFTPDEVLDLYEATQYQYGLSPMAGATYAFTAQK